MHEIKEREGPLPKSVLRLGGGLGLIGMRRQPLKQPSERSGSGRRVNTDVGESAFAFARALNYDPIARMDASPDDGARLTRV